MDKTVAAETIKELQIWLHGEFALVRQNQETDRDELRKVRQTVHDQANQLSSLIMANIPERLAKHSADIDDLREDRAGRRSAVKTATLIGGGIGLLGGSILTLALEIWKVIHP